MAQNFDNWLSSLGPVTKVLIALAFLCTVCTFIVPLVSPADLVMSTKLFTRLHLWRYLTSALFLGKPGFAWLMNLAMLGVYLQRNETDDHPGRPGEMAWMVFVIISAMHGLYFLAPIGFQHGIAFTMALVWVWCRRHEDAVLTIYAFSFRAVMFPWAMLIFHMCIGQDFVSDLVGILCGHAFFFLADILPKTHNIHLVKVPQFVYQFLPNQQLGAYSVHAPPQARFPAPGQPNRGGGHQWGQGRPLNQ